jgi:2-dehydropantoate 2-reductase
MPFGVNMKTLIIGTGIIGTILEFLDRILTRGQYLMGYPDGGGTKRNGVYWTNLGTEVHLGEVDGRNTPKPGMVKALFEKADMRPDIQDNIVHWLWLHNAMSIGIWVGFPKYRDMKQFLKDKPLLVTCFNATR